MTVDRSFRYQVRPLFFHTFLNFFGNYGNLLFDEEEKRVAKNLFL